MRRSGRDLLRAALARHAAQGGMVVGEAVGVHGVTEGLSGGLVRTPLSEAAAVGVGAGLALAGKRVIVELVDPAGLPRAAEILGELAVLRERSAGTWTAPLVVRAPFSTVAVPGVRTVVAATADDLVGLLGHALAASEPVVVLEAAGAFDASGEGGEVAPLGAAVVRRAGGAVTVLAVGDTVAPALAAAESLAAEGIEAEVVDLRALAPLDRATIGASVRKTGRVVAAGAPEGALLALDEAFLHLESPLARLGADASADTIAAAARGAVTY